MQKASKANKYHYNPHLQKYAQELRNKGTKSEACLWKYVLKAGKLQGCKFRRQRSVLNYIADFMCFELMLIIEVDGISHSHEEQILRDEKRTRDLEEIGFTIIRFTDTEVLRDIENVERTLIGFIESRISV